MTLNNRQFVQAIMAGTVLGALPSQVIAQEQQSYNFDLPAQELGDTLRAIAARGDWQIFAAAEDLKGKSAAALRGRFTVQEAVERAVRGSGLNASFDGDSIIIRAGVTDLGKSTHTSDEPTIIVTGTRIKGAPPVVPVTVITANQIKQAGQSDLGEVARNLPQSFGGGQNPGIGNTQGNQNENINVNGASTFNLRGIGPNATLTLINGNRFGYSGTSAAIDVSAIPVAAVERVEIVADGSSAIYGADAVAGVVNIILKPSYSGISASARVGASTDGGNAQQQYTLLAGTSWANGNILATYDYFQNTAINAGDRSYAGSTNADSDLYPEFNRHSVLLSGHQDLATGVSLAADLIFKTGTSYTETGYLLDRPADYQGFAIRNKFQTFGIAPSIELDLSANWSARISGFYGTDKTEGLSRFYFGGAQTFSNVRRYDNESYSAELGLQGRVFELPAGAVRVAAGGGFRSYRFSALTSLQNFKKRRNNYFAYGEVYVPLVDASQDFSWLRSAAVTGALRAEDYSDSGAIIVPKIGFVIEPFDALRLAASWSKSFKLPTLSQQYSGYATLLLDTAGYGVGYPAGSTFIVALGANPGVTAERSENWTVGATLKPAPGLELSISYFDIAYSDRVAPPIASSAGALTNPIYAQFVTSSPTLALQTALVAGADGGLQNGSSGAYEPAAVVAILDARDRNIANQTYKGIDFAINYAISLKGSSKLTFSGAATLLKSEQLLLPGLPVTQLAGIIFNSPKFRARSGVTFDNDRFSLSTFVSHNGGVADNRLLPETNVKSVTSIDFTSRLNLDERTELSFAALNIFNAKPGKIFTGSGLDTPFDTTNYSATGRYIGLALTGKW